MFIAWLNREQSAPLADIDMLLDDFHAERAVLVVSATTYTELLRAKHSSDQVEAFDRFLLRPNIVRVDVSFEIAARAEGLRSSAITTAKRGQQRNIKTPDAQIIATAIIHHVDALHSMEPRHHAISGTKLVDGMRICLPRDLSGQLALSGD